MIGLVWLALAAAMEVPTFVTYPNAWVTGADYPVSAAQRGARGRVDFTLLLAPDGNPDRCVVTRSSGDVELDEHACSLIMKRAKFTPSRDAAGRPIHSTFRNSVNWGSGGERAPAFDLTVPMARSFKLKPDASLTLWVHADMQGKVVNCRLPPKADQVLAGAACAKVTGAQIPPMTDSSGAPVAVLQRLSVKLEPES